MRTARAPSRTGSRPRGSRRRSSRSVLHVAIGGLDRDAQHARDLLGLQAACEQRDDLDLAIGQPGRAVDPRRALPGGLQHRGHGVRVEPSRAGLVSQQLRRRLGGQRLAVCPRSVIA